MASGSHPRRGPLTSASSSDASQRVPPLIELSLEAVISGGLWKFQRRSLARLPSVFGDRLFRRLLANRQLTPPLLESSGRKLAPRTFTAWGWSSTSRIKLEKEQQRSIATHLSLKLRLFQGCVEDVDFSGLAVIDTSWLAYVGAYTHLRSLNLSGCKNVTDAGIWHLLGLSALQTLNLARCSKITTDALDHLLPMHSLRSLDISETAVQPIGVAKLAALTSLTELRLGGIRLENLQLQKLQPLQKLRVFSAWGSALTNKAAALLPRFFPNLETLSLAWTDVTRVPDMPLLTSLDLSQCSVEALFENRDPGQGSARPLRELILAGAKLSNPADWPEFPALTKLDLSRSSSRSDYFFCGRYAGSLTELDLSETSGNASIWGMVSLAQAADKALPLRTLRLLTQGELEWENMDARNEALVSGKFTNLEELSLRGWDYERRVPPLKEKLPALRTLFLEEDHDQSFGQDALLECASLPNLTSLSLVHQNMETHDLIPDLVATAYHLRSLAINDSIIDDNHVRRITRLPYLRSLSLNNGVLSDKGILKLVNMPLLEHLNLSGCWLLTYRGLYDLYERFLSARAGSGPPINIEHEQFSSKKLEAERKSAAQTRSSSIMWVGVGPGGSRSTPSSSRKDSQQSAEKRPRQSGEGSQRQTRSPSVDERTRYDREQLLGLQRGGQASGSSLSQKIPEAIRYGAKTVK